MVRLEGPLAPGAIDWNNDGNTTDSGLAQDINFDNNLFNTGTGTFDLPFAGFDDWDNIDLRQIGGAPGVFGYSGDTWGTFDNSGPGGTGRLGAGASATGGMTGDGDGGTGRLGAGTGRLGAGTGRLGAGAEADFDLANSTVDPPTGLGAKQVSKTVVLTWTPPGFGQIRTYYIWRANTTNGPISATNLPVNVGKVTGTPPALTFTDSSKLMNKNTYTYFVTSALGADSGKNSGNQSGPSNMVAITVVF
jgi:hypothetical protein